MAKKENAKLCTGVTSTCSGTFDIGAFCFHGCISPVALGRVRNISQLANHFSHQQVSWLSCLRSHSSPSTTAGVHRLYQSNLSWISLPLLVSKRHFHARDHHFPKVPACIFVWPFPSWSTDSAHSADRCCGALASPGVSYFADTNRQFLPWQAGHSSHSPLLLPSAHPLRRWKDLPSKSGSKSLAASSFGGWRSHLISLMPLHFQNASAPTLACASLTLACPWCSEGKILHD